MSDERFNRLPTTLHTLGLTRTEMGVYMALVSHANWTTGKTRLRRDTIANEIECHVMSVSKAVNRLTELGLIETQRTGRSSMFRVIFDWTPGTDQRVSRPSADQPAGDEKKPDRFIRGSGTASSDEAVRLHPHNKSYLNESVSNEEPHLSSSSYVSKGETEQAEQLAHDLLGAELIEESSLSNSEVEGETSSQEDATPTSGPGDQSDTGQGAGPLDDLEHRKTMALDKAQTEKPRKLWATFNPENAGYTRSDFSREFPLLDWKATVARFVDFYLDKSPKTNWMATFFGYAAEAQRRAAEERQQNPRQTDSMGLPADHLARRVGDTEEAMRERLRLSLEQKAKWADADDSDYATWEPTPID